MWLNFADKQIGLIDTAKTAQPMIAVRFFSTSANYVSGDFVVQAGGIWVANTSVTAGAFNPSQWRELAYLTDIPALYVLPTASVSVLGGVKIDGTTITISSGVISSAGLVVVSSVAPSPVQSGALWYDLVGGQLYVWANDGSSSQWVVAVNQSLGGVYLPLNGGTLTGPLILYADPVAPLEAVTKQYADAHGAINDNRIINGDMRIDQRNNGASVAVAGYCVDRWIVGVTQTKAQWGRAAGSAPGFPYTFNFTTTAAYAVTASDSFGVSQSVEADMVSDLQWGTANAQPVTLSFWANSSAPGTFTGSIVNNPSPFRSYVFTYTLGAGWTKVVVNIPGDTAGTWAMGGNATGLTVRFNFGAGSNFQTTPNSWQAGNFTSVAGATSVVAINGAILQITGVKLEIGSVATPFNRQSPAKSMADCQRYYQPFANFSGAGYGAAGAGVIVQGGFPYAPMRATPTVTATWGTNIGLPAAITPVINSTFILVSSTTTAAGQWGFNMTSCLLSAEL